MILNIQTLKGGSILYINLYKEYKEIYYVKDILVGVGMYISIRIIKL